MGFGSIRKTHPWHRYLFADGGYAGPNLRVRWKKSIAGQWKSSNALIRQKELKLSHDAGAWKETSHGWVDTEGYPKIGRKPSNQLKAGCLLLT